MTEAEDSAGQRKKRRRLLFLVLLLILLFLILILIFLIFLLRPSQPRADAGGPYEVGEGQPLPFDGSGSAGRSIDYTWDFGDGNTGNGVSPSHAYDDGPAQFTVMLVVTDNRGRTASDTTQVTVNNLPPTADAGGPYSCVVGETITLSGTCDDPGPVDMASLTCTWADFSGAAIVQPSYTCPPSPGQVAVTLTATDKDGASAQDSNVVTVTGPLPPATATSTATTVPNKPPEAIVEVNLILKTAQCYRFNGSESFDPDGWIVTYEWDFGDGNTDVGEVFEYCYEASGTYTATLTVTDNQAGTDSASTQVVIPNIDPP